MLRIIRLTIAVFMLVSCVIGTNILFAQEVVQQKDTLNAPLNLDHDNFREIFYRNVNFYNRYIKNDIKVLILDLDNTLYTHTKLAGVMREYGHDFIIRAIMKELSISKKAALKMFEAGLQKLTKQFYERFMREPTFNETCEHFSEDFDVSVENWDRELEQGIDPGKFLTPDMKLQQVLEFLSRKYKLVLITDHTALQTKRIFQALGIADYNKYFENISTSSQKPNNDLINYVAHKLNVDPDQCAAIGDSFERDIIPALQEGMHGIPVGSAKEFRVLSYLIEHLEKGRVNIEQISKMFSVSHSTINNVLRRSRMLLGEVCMELDENTFSPTGNIASRKFMHEHGIWHKTVHVLGISEDGEHVILQHRNDKTGRKGLFITGHVQAEESDIETLFNEADEEMRLGRGHLNGNIYQLKKVFSKEGSNKNSTNPILKKDIYYYHSPDRLNREITVFYVVVVPVELEVFFAKGINTKEVIKMERMPWDELFTDVMRNPEKYNSAVPQYFLRADFIDFLLSINFSTKRKHIPNVLQKIKNRLFFKDVTEQEGLLTPQKTIGKYLVETYLEQAI